MKRSILVTLALASFAFAGVSETTIGCVDKNDLREFEMLHKQGKIKDIKSFYKYTIEKDCQIIEVNDEIKLLGKPYSDGTALVYVKKYDKDLYIEARTIKNQYTPDNHKFNKSF